MKEKILQLIKILESNGLKNINFLGLVTSTCSQTVFYCDYNGKCYQSNQLIEETDFDINVVEKFCENVVSVIRASSEFEENKLNVIKIYFDKRFQHILLDEEEDFFDIEDDWENEIGLG